VALLFYQIEHREMPVGGMVAVPADGVTVIQLEDRNCRILDTSNVR
jgi:hypothetical protein